MIAFLILICSSMLVPADDSAAKTLIEVAQSLPAKISSSGTRNSYSASGVESRRFRYRRDGTNVQLETTYSSGSVEVIIISNRKLFGFFKGPNQQEFRQTEMCELPDMREETIRKQSPSNGVGYFGKLIYADPEFFICQFAIRTEQIGDSEDRLVTIGTSPKNLKELQELDKSETYFVKKVLAAEWPNFALTIDNHNRITSFATLNQGLATARWKLTRKEGKLQSFSEERVFDGVWVKPDDCIYDSWEEECLLPISPHAFGVAINTYTLPAVLIVLILVTAAYFLILQTKKSAKHDERKASRTGFTLIELFVVLATISILITLLLPAVQSLRESARLNTCKNNLRELGMGVQSFRSAHKQYPGCGWSYWWIALSDQGIGDNQPGGWMYRIMPYIEQNSLFLSAPTTQDLDASNQFAFHSFMMARIPLLNCPSKVRRVSSSPQVSEMVFGNFEFCEKSDYAMSAGQSMQPPTWKGPLSLEDGQSANFEWPREIEPGIARRRVARGEHEVVDGDSNTLLFGEKRLAAHRGMCVDDNQPYCTGFGVDTCRWTFRLDNDYVDGANNGFGGPHPGVTIFVRCDGSVQAESNEIDFKTLNSLGNIADGN
jgi:type II secretory pathway pseudopilin PulG